ncbi:MAG: hypothetical protein IKK09_01685 [Clostridia bacterium]|nr:hypothetical protein [Clostridia bacterium]
MNYPQMGRNRKYTLNIPDFSGGINASKPIQDIQDNQAAMIKNMWLKDGVLQTRPALKVGSDEAYLSSNSLLYDIGLELKYSYELYSSAAASLGNLISKSGRLFRSGKTYLIYSNETNGFVPITLEFNSQDAENIFSNGNIENEYFFENGTITHRIDKDETKTDYYEVVSSKIYGYINLRPNAQSEVRRLFACFVFELISGEVSGEVVTRLKMYDLDEDLPAEYTPYAPTVILGSGSTAVTLDDFNLMTDDFKQQMLVSKDLSQYTVYEGNEANDSYYEGDEVREVKSFNLGDGYSKEYGNDYFTKPINFKYQEIPGSTIDRIVVYGQFKFGYWKAQLLKDKYKYGEIGRESVPVIGGGTNTHIYYGKTDEEIPEGYYLDSDPKFYELKTATKLVIENPSFDFHYRTYKYYDSYDREVDPVAAFVPPENDETYIYPSINGGTSATFSNGILTIRFPTNERKNIKTYKKRMEEHYQTGVVEECYEEIEIPSYPAAGIYIDEIYIFQSVRSYGDRADLVIKNPLKTTFGGTNSGYAGGTRLFVAGNPEHKNVLRWSGVNDFSYFLENNFTYIGRDDEAITALGKQDGYLVVFKENELYALEYASTTDSENELIVYFPVTPISPYIGCDCPLSIQFVANRLTWLTSDGKVYTLFSENSYSERNVREVSKHIENELKKHSREQLKAARSVDYNGNYMLFIGDTVYIWNYDRNPLYNYSSSEKAQQNLCWFKWEFPHTVEYVCEKEGDLIVICCDGKDHQGYVLDYNSCEDDTVGTKNKIPIVTSYKSKLWDFGNPFKFKKINRAFFEIEAASGEIEVRFFTENGTDSINTRLDARYSGNKAYNTRPHLVRVRSAGFELESKAAVKLYSAALFAETYGEVK